MTFSLDLAGKWFLRSGIQETSGGVARYYLADTRSNLPISNEITGYAVSALAFVYERTGDVAYQQAALKAASFLADVAWDAANSTFPFEPLSDRAYFFDLGIIARGLMSAHRISGEDQFHERAKDAALSLAFDFLGDAVFHTVISLPEKQPLPEEPRWSRQPGCFQLKAATAWREMNDEHAAKMFDTALALALATHDSFFAAEKDPARIMDRLHAYSYFLEALLWAGEHPEAREALAAGVDRAAALLREIAPTFERSDVSAQLLRVRLIAHHMNLLALDETAAKEEAARIATFQAVGDADTHVAGGFWFGRKVGEMLPYSNPVSTAFCLQALVLWDDHQNGRWNFKLSQLI